MGRDWLQALGVEISFKPKLFELNQPNVNIDHFVETNVKKLYIEFPEVFTEKLGKYKGEPIKLKLKENANSKYCKPRPLPFTLKAKVESELQHLVEADVLCPVTSSE